MLKQRIGEECLSSIVVFVNPCSDECLLTLLPPQDFHNVRFPQELEPYFIAINRVAWLHLII
jgi:hypothetical protein